MADNKIGEIERQRAEIERLRVENFENWKFYNVTYAKERKIEEPRAEIERLREAHQAACEGGDLLRAEIERLTRERDEARAEVERLRAEIDGLEAELSLMKSGFEVAYRAMGDKP